MLSRFETTSTTCKQDWEVVVVVSITIANTGSVDQESVIKHGSVTLFDRLHSVEDIGELSGVIGVNLLLFGKFVLLATVVANVMVSITDADLGIGPVRTVVCEHKGADTCEICLERENHHVSHEANVLPKVAWNACWLTESCCRLESCRVLEGNESLFNISDC